VERGPLLDRQRLERLDQLLIGRQEAGCLIVRTERIPAIPDLLVEARLRGGRRPDGHLQRGQSDFETGTEMRKYLGN